MSLTLPGPLDLAALLPSKPLLRHWKSLESQRDCPEVSLLDARVTDPTWGLAISHTTPLGNPYLSSQRGPPPFHWSSKAFLPNISKTFKLLQKTGRVVFKQHLL